MELMTEKDIAKARKLIEENTRNDDLIEKLIHDGELMYVVLEKIIDGTLDKKFIKIMLNIKAKSSDLEDFQTLLEIGVMDGELKMSDIESPRSKSKKHNAHKK